MRTTHNSEALSPSTPTRELIPVLASVPHSRINRATAHVGPSHSSPESSRPPGHDHALCVVCISCPSPRPIFGRRGAPWPWDMRSSSRSPGLPGAHLCLAAPVHSRSPDALACIQGPILPVHDLRYAWRKTLRAPHALPRPSPAQCRSAFAFAGFPPRGPWDPLRKSRWRFALTVLGKQSSTSPNVMLMDSSTNACSSFWQVRPKPPWMPQCLMASRRTTSSTVASMFRETFQPSMGQTSDAALRQPLFSAASPKRVDSKGQQTRLLGPDRVFLVQESPPGGTVVHCGVSHCSVRPAVNTRHFSRCTSTGLGKVIKAIGIACALPCAPGRAMRRRTPPALRPSTSLSAPSR